MKIASIETFPVSYPTKRRFKFLEDPQGRRVGRAAVIVKITADDGTVGWGESIPVHTWCYETLESTTSTINHYLAPVLIGHEAFDLAGTHTLMNRTISPGWTTGMPLTKCGIDMALHDLCCKAMNCSLAHYWGHAAGGEITLSWTLNPESLDQVDAMIDEGWNQGYRNFNIKVAPNLAYDIELCKRVRKRVPEGFLWADANGGYDLPTALQAAPKLADAGADVLEQPIRPNEISGFRQLKRQGALPILMDEGVISPRDLIELLRLEALDGVAMKPSRCAGLLPARQQIEILQNAGLMFLGSGLSDPDIALSASLILFSAYGLSFPAALNGPQFLNQSAITQPFTPDHGSLAVPTGPGLGIQIDEEKIQAIRVDLG